MKTYIKRNRKNKAASTPLLDWRSSPPRRPATHAGLHITRRYRINPVIADLIASLAGLGVNVEGGR